LLQLDSQSVGSALTRCAPRWYGQPLPDSDVRPRMVSEPTDTQLVLAIAGGDRRALASLYERYASLLLSVGVRMLGERREAEDVVHDVFLEVWRKAGAFDGARGTVRTWLLLRMRSRARDRMKSPSAARSRPLDDAVPPTQVVDPGFSRVEEATERAAVARALDALSQEQRRVLELAFYAGLSSSEIASAEGIPIGTVKSRMRAALGRLREEFGTTAGGAGGSGR
jgi:RNA polymerase sigma-70 factor (ECF subfamily)